ncbi:MULTISPECIES: excalibur calcium-binding domain-containing protein [Exiguobacterium]|uniref:excalibur calcium-binding domain-containing protein n=1 Tax=Exiguobacterium TaxID=33986 RepID=UPI001BE689AF|nr:MULTISPECIES: excalibur calcium-binding domain-containing protein [Exiguobacterium]MCT4791042.1 hypothetical protein [Exiguobacterium artemiae]
MNFRKGILLIVIAIVYLLFFTITFWSVIGLIVSVLGLYFYFKPRLRNSVKYPVSIVWLGVFIAFAISIYNVEGTEAKKTVTESTSEETEVLVTLKKETKQLKSSLKNTQLELEKEQQETKMLKDKLSREKELRLQTVESYQEESDKRSELESDLKEEETKRIAAEEKVDELESSLASIETMTEEISDEEYVDEEGGGTETEVTTDLEYDPYGGDRDCGDFSSAQAAQDFYLAAGGPANDPHDLDRDNDGNACDWN